MCCGHKQCMIHSFPWFNKLGKPSMQEPPKLLQHSFRQTCCLKRKLYALISDAWKTYRVNDEPYDPTERMTYLLLSQCTEDGLPTLMIISVAPAASVIFPNPPQQHSVFFSALQYPTNLGHIQRQVACEGELMQSSIEKLAMSSSRPWWTSQCLVDGITTLSAFVPEVLWKLCHFNFSLSRFSVGHKCTWRHCKVICWMALPIRCVIFNVITRYVHLNCNLIIHLWNILCICLRRWNYLERWVHLASTCNFQQNLNKASQGKSNNHNMK